MTESESPVLSTSETRALADMPPKAEAVTVKEIVMDGAGQGTVTLSNGRQLGGVLGCTVLADTGQMVSVLLRIQCPQVRIGPGQKAEPQPVEQQPE